MALLLDRFQLVRLLAPAALGARHLQCPCRPGHRRLHRGRHRALSLLGLQARCHHLDIYRQPQGCRGQRLHRIRDPHPPDLPRLSRLALLAPVQISGSAASVVRSLSTRATQSHHRQYPFPSPAARTQTIGFPAPQYGLPPAGRRALRLSAWRPDRVHDERRQRLFQRAPVPEPRCRQPRFQPPCLLAEGRALQPALPLDVLRGSRPPACRTLPNNIARCSEL